MLRDLFVRLQTHYRDYVMLGQSSCQWGPTCGAPHMHTMPCAACHATRCQHPQKGPGAQSFKQNY